MYRMTDDYTVVEGNSTQKSFIEDVNMKINAGYKVAGGVFVEYHSSQGYISRHYYQALIKKNSGTTSSGGKKKPSRRKTRKNRRKY